MRDSNEGELIMTKIKIFENSVRYLMEDDVNKFIANKEVINISFAVCNKSGTYYHCCVVYKEN